MIPIVLGSQCPDPITNKYDITSTPTQPFNPRLRHLKNDLGLIFVKKYVTKNRTIIGTRDLSFEEDAPWIFPICVDLLVNKYNEQDDILYALGWGRVSPSLSEAPTLQILKGQRLPISECISSWSNDSSLPFDPIGPDTNEAICFGKDKFNICTGDYGAPLQYEDQNLHWQLLGIASFSGDVCGDAKPGVFVNVHTPSNRQFLIGEGGVKCQ